MISFGMTDIGRKRKVNQDYLFYSDEPVGCFPNLYIVADGMGGHKAGDKASSCAVNRFVKLAGKEKNEMPFLVMERLLKEVNREIYELSCGDVRYSGMGTTFVAATVVDNKAYVMNVGDSRLYYFDGTLRQVTMDHSLVEELVRAGELDRTESRNHPQKNIITKAVGVDPEITPDFFMVEMEENSRLLLCSDGLTNMVEDSLVREILNTGKTEEEQVQRCIEEALFYGGLDNIAVVIARYERRR
ncbi:MAG: Stp1/IreP family PP2C-type Ser/Thr phosphatase [Lachnospiraceae bacterium]|nr:Stp1/IreP family PP2C-type Ser/Thr phosphatase [Lachnospiraceae bacterium]MDY5497174.1 Stp1/IreP family PP2C-type Ser/Thr phosphatase [Anaerobutyricum sp.]